MMPRDHDSSREAGFTLMEALIALALTGFLMSSLAMLTAQFMPNWNRGFDRIQNSELIGISMQRIASDLAAAEFIPAAADDSSGPKKRPLFEGTPSSVTFVRTAIGPNAAIGLDIVNISEISDQGRLVTARTRTGFTPSLEGTLGEQLRRADPVVLLRAPLRLSFAYAGPDGVFHDRWNNAEGLPAAIRLMVRNGRGEQELAISTVAPVHVDAPAGKPEGNGAALRAGNQGAAANGENGGGKRGGS